MSVASLYPWIKPYLPGAPEAAIDAEIVAAVKELANSSLSMRDTEYLPTQAGWGSYHLEIPADRVLLNVSSVCVNGASIDPLASMPCSGCNEYGFFLDNRQVLHLFPAPAIDEQDGIELEYAYAPRYDSCEIDEDFAERYGHAIAAAVKGRMMLMAGQKWYNEKLSRVFLTEWSTAKSSAILDGPSRFTRGHINMTVANQDWIDS